MANTQYGAVLIDLDGTLLGRDNKTIPLANVDAIKAAHTNFGVDVVLASGRYSPSLEPYSDQLAIQGCPLICLNGMVKSARENGARHSLWHSYIPTQFMKDFINYSNGRNAAKKQIYLQCFIHDENTQQEILYSLDDKTSKEYAEIYAANSGSEFKFVSSFQELDMGKILKLIMLDKDPSLIDLIQGEFKCNGYTPLQIVRTYQGSDKRPAQLEIMNMSKGQAVEKLAGLLRIDRKKIIAIGDGDNDVEMLKAAGLGVVVANATQKAKEAAGYTTSKNNEEGGVAEAINKFILSS